MKGLSLILIAWPLAALIGFLIYGFIVEIRQANTVGLIIAGIGIVGLASVVIGSWLAEWYV